jgi:hypothetical protein
MTTEKAKFNGKLNKGRGLASQKQISGFFTREMKRVKAGEQTMCESIRMCAKKYRGARRIDIAEVLVTQFGLNPGTVSRQIQLGRQK